MGNLIEEDEMKDLLITYDPSIRPSAGDLNARVENGSLVLPLLLRAFFEERRLRTARQLLSLLGAVPDGLRRALGWSSGDVVKARVQLAKALHGHVPEHVLVPPGPPLRRGMGATIPPHKDPDDHGNGD